MSRIQLLAAVAGALFLSPGDSTSRAPGIPLVVNGEWLQSRLGQPGLLVLQVGDRRLFESEHVPGARQVTFDMISTPHAEGALSLELPSADTLRARFERLGISDDSRIVVVFSGNWTTAGTRLLLTLDHLGLGAQSALLDGGLSRWKQEGRPVSADVASVTPGRLSKRPVKQVTVDAATVQAHAKGAGHRIVDARAPVFYAGRGHGNHRPGHVPGAVNIPFTSVFDDSLRVVGRDSLERLFTNAGVQKGDTILAYCHIGQQATAVVFAARLLGRPVKLYDGSFEDWSRRTELPTEGGDAKDGR